MLQLSEDDLAQEHRKTSHCNIRCLQKYMVPVNNIASHICSLWICQHTYLILFQLSKDDVARRERRKESNRNAARRCREKKMMEQARLIQVTHRILIKYIYTKITEVNLSAFIYRLFQCICSDH